nr:MAG TPA: hypothetical protein [Caudoviricetes sp.]
MTCARPILLRLYVSVRVVDVTRHLLRKGQGVEKRSCSLLRSVVAWLRIRLLLFLKITGYG